MPYIPITDDQEKDMLKFLGFKSYDEMLDIISQKKEYDRMMIGGWRPDRNIYEDSAIEAHRTLIQEILSRKPSMYLNYCLSEKTGLLYN